MNGGGNTLQICNSINDNWNHCHNTIDVGTDWFNLKISQKPQTSLVTKFNHVSNAVYNYQVLTDQADQFEYFTIDADFNNDVHIGFSATAGHDDAKWEIVIGGWSGTKSVIRPGNQVPDDGLVNKSHTKAEFDEFKRNLKLQVTDGRIDVFTGDEIFMQLGC